MSPSESKIEMTTIVNAPRERVFRALTDPRELTRWFPTTAASEPVPGGRFELTWRFAEEPERDHEQAGRYDEVVKNARVVLPWHAPGQDAPTRVAYELRDADGGGTELRLAHDGWTTASAETVEHHRQGWAFFLQNLKRVLEGGEDQREQAVGMKVA